MNQLKNAILFSAIAILLLVPISCAKDRDCGKGYIYNDKDNLCYKVSSAKPNKKVSNNDADADQEGGDGESADTLSGFGDSCTDQDQCSGKGADYCAVNPLDGKGMCTTRGCNSDAECPTGYYCCLAPESYGGHVCVTKELYDMGKPAGAC
jgi:hypothetical protein